MSESSTPEAAADGPVPEPATDLLAPVGTDPAGPDPARPDPARPDPDGAAPDGATPDGAAPDAPGRSSAGAATPGRHRRAGGVGRTVVLSPRTAAALRLARAVTPIALVAATLVACTTSSAPPAPPTARVERADVTTAVSSSGALAAVTEQNLGFVRGGQLTAVDVTVGQRVTAGQVLARVDDAPLRRVLEQQQGQLDSQRAALARQVNATAVTGAQNTTNQAEDILAATRDQRSETIDADEAAIDRAEKQLGFDKDARDDAEEQADDAEDACRAAGGSPSGSSGSSGSSVDTSAILSGLGSSGSGSGSGSGSDSDSDSADDSDSDSDEDSDSESLEEKRKRLEAALAAAGALAGSLGSGSAASSACSQAASAQSNLTAAERQVEASRTALDQARNRRDVDAAAQQVQVENAQQGVVSAQNNLDSARTDRPSLIAQQRGVVVAQEAIVRQAQQDVEDTVLRAPADGTVAAVNGAVGEFLTAGSTTTPLAPGSEGAIPGAGAATGAAGAAGGVSRPGGTQFIVLDNVDRFEVVVPFEESDAVRITPNQKVNVGFDAIPDLTLPGTVVAVSPSATALSGVISYYATVALQQGDPRLRNGQTAQASVLTTEVADVLSVPNSAVRRQGDRTTVTVQQFDGQRTVEFQPGVVGDDRTQVLSGLTAGDEVVVPSGR